MAGTLELSEELCWLPPGWIWDNALLEVAERLDDEDLDLRERLLNSLTTVNAGYLDLRECGEEKLRAFQTALSLAVDETVRIGSSGFYDPAFYEVYVKQLHELQEILAQRLEEFALFRRE